MLGTETATTAEQATWCEIDSGALRENMQNLRQAIGSDTRLGIVVKSDAYGHGLLDCARVFVEAGADWLVVHSHGEAVMLRDGGLQQPVLVCGPTQPEEAALAVSTGARVVAYDTQVVGALAEAGRRAGASVPLHLKVETGTHRQGVGVDAIVDFARHVQAAGGVHIEGACTHLADVEDGEDHDFARHQLTELHHARRRLEAAGIHIEMWHAASSAAALVLPESRADLVRVGIAAYGLWPSAGIERLTNAVAPDLRLQPALTWRARVAQVQDMEPGGSVGYGRTWRAGGRARRIAILPVGYHEGFSRARSNQGHVLLRGLPAPVRGRVCMNLTMVDVTDVEAATGSPVGVGEVATLLGTDGDTTISAEQFASWSGTIHYEIVTRIHPCVPRRRVDARGDVEG